MAKQTGQITVLKNNTVTNVEHQIRFIFTKENGERITRDTTSKGIINFDIPNGDWNVSWFAVDGDQKVLPLRAGLQLKITSSTPTTALADWIYGDNTHVADPILTQWTTVLDEMKSVRDQFRDETNFVGDLNGKIMREGAGGWLTNASQKVPKSHSFKTKLPSGAYALYEGLYDRPSWQESGDAYLTFGWSPTYYIDLVFGTRGKIAISATRNGNKSQWYDLYTQENTTVDSNGFIKSASPIIKLFDDRIETNGQFKEEPIFEKISAGTYKISNTLGLAKEGWTYEKPRGSDGNPYFRIIAKKTEDGCIITVHDEYVDYEDREIIDSDGNKRTVQERVTVLSAARDIKDHERWIDLRFHEEPQREAEMLAEMEAEHKEE